MDKCIRAHDGPVYMGFSGKMTNTIDLIVIKNAGHRLLVAYIGFYEDVASWSIVLNPRQIFRVACIGQLIHINHAP